MNPSRGLLHHVNINVSSVARSAKFYGPVLTFLGYKLATARYEGNHAYEDWYRPDLGTPHMITLCQASSALSLSQSDRNAVGRFSHFAFCANDRADVDRFFAEVLAPLEKQGLCVVEDPPCDCPEYSTSYYATFFFDPDGLKYEFVFNPDN